MNTYPVDPENAVEMARLLNQHALITSAIGGVLVELHADQTARLRDVLDLACGPGGWVLETARFLPHASVTGIDVSAIMVDYSRVTAQTLRLTNAHFMTMNLNDPLLFPDDSFDLINGRLLSSLLTQKSWLMVLPEIWRVCRTQGIVCLTDHDLPVTNSPACERLHQLFAKAYQLTGRSPGIDGKTLDFASRLSSLLQNAGYQNVQERRYTMDISANTPLHNGFYQNALSTFQVFQPFFTGFQLISDSDYQHLYQQMLKEVLAPNFRATSDLLTAWGEKP